MAGAVSGKAAEKSRIFALPAILLLIAWLATIVGRKTEPFY
jgi:hypothetical protein